MAVFVVLEAKQAMYEMEITAEQLNAIKQAKLTIAKSPVGSALLIPCNSIGNTLLLDELSTIKDSLRLLQMSLCSHSGDPITLEAEPQQGIANLIDDLVVKLEKSRKLITA